MNARQFLNSVVSAALEKSPAARSTLAVFPKFLFPEFLRAARIQDVKNPFTFALIIYLIVFFLVFVMQAAFAQANGVLYSANYSVAACLAKDQACLQYFLNDVANFFNYTVLVEAYCISGCFFLVYANKMDELLCCGEHADRLRYSAPPSSLFGGALAVLFAIFLVLLGAVGYAIEIQSYPPHWYMNFKPGSTGLLHSGAQVANAPYVFAAHYYYVLVNFLLLLFVAFVGMAHFGLFKTVGAISKQLRVAYDSDDQDLVNAWLDEDRVRKWFTPFSTQVLVSKIFVLSIILNMSSWKMWEASAGLMNDIAVIIMVVVGIWLVTMPRYFIQFHLFRLRKKHDIDEYKDVRMSWILGGSAAVDILLLGIAGNVLFNRESVFEFIGEHVIS